METAEATAVGGKIPTSKKSGLPLYVIHTNKNGVSFKIANFDNPDVCPTTGIVEYEAIKKRNFDAFMDTGFSCPVTKNKTTEIIYGIFNGFHNNGDPKWISFPLKMINVFDRSVSTEAKKACIMAQSPLTLGSSNQSSRNGIVKFRLVDKEQAAIEKINKINNAERALSHAKGLSGEKLMSMALNLGIATENASIFMVTAEVMTRAQEYPIEYLKVAENPNIEVISVLNRAIDTKVVDIDTHKGYTYKGATLGHNFDFAIDFLLKNREVLAIIDMASKDADAQGKKATNFVEEKEQNPEMEAMKVQLAEMKAQNEALLAKSKLPADSGQTQYDPLEAELADLLVTAKELKLRGLHMYKPTVESIAKLKEAIANKK